MWQHQRANVQHLKVQSCPSIRFLTQQEQVMTSLHMVQVEAVPKKPTQAPTSPLDGVSNHFSFSPNTALGRKAWQLQSSRAPAPLCPPFPICGVPGTWVDPLSAL